MNSTMRPASGIQLRWESYLGDLRTLLQHLRRSEELTDVVLTNGSARVRCHRVILSAACHTFHQLLKEHPGDVVICLGGVDSADLRSLVDYMYSGEVEVARGRLADFLALAGQWGVRGLEESPPPSRPAGQPAQTSDICSSTLEQIKEGLPRLLEINSSRPSPGRGSGRGETSTAESTWRRKGKSRDPASGSEEEEGTERAGPLVVPTSREQGTAWSDSSSEGEPRTAAPRPSAISGAVLSAIRPDTASKSKRAAQPQPSSRPTEPRPSSAPDSASKSRSPRAPAASKSHNTALATVPNMFACPHCPRVFVKPHYFEGHLRTQHDDSSAPEQHRVQLSAGGGRMVHLAGGVLSMKLPAATKKKAKTAKPEKTKKKKKKRSKMTPEEREAEAAAVVAAADAAVRAALERAAALSKEKRPELPEPAGGSGGPSAKGSARDVMAAPAKRARVASSSDDSDSDSSVEVTKPSGKAPAPAAAAPVPVTARPPPAPAPPPVAVGPPPSATPAPRPPAGWPPLHLPPPVVPRRDPPPGAAPGAASGTPRPSRIVFDENGESLTGRAAAPVPPRSSTEEQEDVKPIIISPVVTPPPGPPPGVAGPASAPSSTTGAREGRRWPTERPHGGWAGSGPQRRESLGNESDSSRGTRIVFDQEGRPRPADQPPPPPPPVGIATHVRREAAGRDETRPAPDGDRDRHPAPDRGGQRDQDRHWDHWDQHHSTSDIADRDLSETKSLDRGQADNRGPARGRDRGRGRGRDRSRSRSRGRGGAPYHWSRDGWEGREDPWLRREHSAEPADGGRRHWSAGSHDGGQHQRPDDGGRQQCWRRRGRGRSAH